MAASLSLKTVKSSGKEQRAENTGKMWLSWNPRERERQKWKVEDGSCFYHEDIYLTWPETDFCSLKEKGQIPRSTKIGESDRQFPKWQNDAFRTNMNQEKKIPTHLNQLHSIVEVYFDAHVSP